MRNTEMSLKYFSKLFRFKQKYQSRLLNSPNPVLNTQFRVLLHSEPTVRVETQLTQFNNEKLKISSYLEKSHEKYDVVKIEDIDLTEETNFKSLVLLKDLVDRSKKRSSEEEPEMNIISEELTNCIVSECIAYSLNDILKYIILTAKIGNKDSRGTLIGYLNAELKKRALSKEEHFRVLYVSAVLLRKIYFTVDFMYTKNRVFKFIEKIRSLTIEQVVVLFYLLCKFPKEFRKDFNFHVESHLLENLPKFNFDELIIVSRGFLKSDMQIARSSFPVAVAKKLMEEIENPWELSAFWVFKLIGSKALKYDEIDDFQKKILPHAGKFEGQDLVYLATTGANIAYVNLSLWEILANNFKKNIRNYSLINIEKMVYMTVICSIQDEELLKRSIEEFQSADLSSSSSSSSSSSKNALISFVYDLIHHQIYPEKLLSLILSKDFRLKYDPESFSVTTKQKYCFINSFIQFHRPESNFEFLETKEQLKLYKTFNIFPEHIKVQLICYKSLRKIAASLQSIYGENFAFLTSVQPHFRKGIVMRFDKNLEAQPIPEEFLLSTENYKRALNDDHIWLFIRVLHFPNYKQDTDIPNFETQTEIREVEAFGYAPLLIHNEVWLKRRISEDSEDYLKDVLKNKVQEVKNEQQSDQDLSKM